MKQYNFTLQKSVVLTPLSGTTIVNINTTGELLINDGSSAETHRERSITLADTGKGVLSRSPKGLNRTVKITLPLTEATEEEFHNQVCMLFGLMKASEIGLN